MRVLAAALAAQTDETRATQNYYFQDPQICSNLQGDLQSLLKYLQIHEARDFKKAQSCMLIK